MSQQETPVDTTSTAAPAGAEEVRPSEGPNPAAPEYRPYDNRNRSNNTQRNRSGSGSFQGNYGGRGGNRGQPPQMTTPVAQQYANQNMYTQQGYYQQGGYQAPATNMDPELTNYYSSSFYTLFNQYKSAGYDDATAYNAANTYATQYLNMYIQQKTYAATYGQQGVMAQQPAMYVQQGVPQGGQHMVAAQVAYPQQQAMGGQQAAPQYQHAAQTQPAAAAQPYQHAQTVDAPASWEATPVLPGSTNIGAPPALTKVAGAGAASTTAVPSSSSRPNNRVYTRQHILDLKPATFETIAMYTTGAVVTGEVTPDGRKGGGFGKGGQGRGEYRDRGNNEGGGRRGGKGEGDEWSKEKLSPKAPPQKPNIPFKKDVKNDPLAALEVDATEIINKITPETFEKLSKKTLELKVVNTTMLDTLVKLIFEAAVTQAGFSGVFADLCNFLTENATQWNFFTVVKHFEKEEYFWIRDVVFPEEYAGPFYEKSAIASAIESNNAPMKAMPGQNLSSVEVLLLDNHLVRIGKNMSEAYLVTYLPFESVPAENRSQSLFTDEASAKKDAGTQVSFRACLAQNCEREFNASVQDENLYDGVDEEFRQLRARRATMSESEFERLEQDIEEKRIKIKRRMLGNIKFVGELYKRKLLNTETMHYCITKLIGTPDQTVHDEQDLELLLHMLTTLGESLEQKSRKAKNKTLAVKFDEYFVRLEQLRKDLSLPSRIRFAIDDLIRLRERNWQGKKQAEGPMKISELHSKLQEDQKAANAAAAKNNNNNSKAAPNANKGGRGGPQDVRAASGKNAPPAGKGGNAPPATKGGPNKGPVDTKRPTGSAPAAASEVVLTMKEQGLAFHGQLVLETLEKLLNLSDANKRKKLLELTGHADLLAEYARGREAVKQAVESHEGFKNLVDTLVDVKEAPERIAAFLAVLVRGNVLTEAWIQDLVVRFHAYNIEQDYNPVEDIEAAFNRFKTTLASELQ
eukprot:gene13240-9485_t